LVCQYVYTWGFSVSLTVNAIQDIFLQQRVRRFPSASAYARNASASDFFTLTLKISRLELCDLLIATTSVANALEKDGHTAKKWRDLHDKLEEQLNAFDKKNGPEFFGE
jgi:hypothetical protein